MLRTCFERKKSELQPLSILNNAFTSSELSTTVCTDFWFIILIPCNMNWNFIYILMFRASGRPFKAEVRKLRRTIILFIDNKLISALYLTHFLSLHFWINNRKSNALLSDSFEEMGIFRDFNLVRYIFYFWFRLSHLQVWICVLTLIIKV